MPGGGGDSAASLFEVHHNLTRPLPGLPGAICKVDGASRRRRCVRPCRRPTPTGACSGPTTGPAVELLVGGSGQPEHPRRRLGRVRVAERRRHRRPPEPRRLPPDEPEPSDPPSGDGPGGDDKGGAATRRRRWSLGSGRLRSRPPTRLHPVGLRRPPTPRSPRRATRGPARQEERRQGRQAGRPGRRPRTPSRPRRRSPPSETAEAAPTAEPPDAGRTRAARLGRPGRDRRAVRRGRGGRPGPQEGLAPDDPSARLPRDLHPVAWWVWALGLATGGVAHDQPAAAAAAHRASRAWS